MIIFAVINGFIEGFWRRVFGGYETKWKWVNERGVQTAFNIIFLSLVFYFGDWKSRKLIALIPGNKVLVYGIASVLGAVYFQICFWTRGHGAAFDIGRDKLTDETLKWYHREWYSFIPNSIVPENHWYGFIYDCIWFWCRYSLCLIPLIFYFYRFDVMILGLLAVVVYGTCWTLYEREKWLFDKIPYNLVDGPTALAELLFGFMAGFMITFL